MKYRISFEAESNADLLVVSNCAAEFKRLVVDSADKHVAFLFDSLCRQFDFSDTTKENLKVSLLKSEVR